MKKLFITLLVLIAIVAVGGYFLFLKAITPGDLPAKVMMAEEAVATSGTIAIASVDMTYIRRIDKLLDAGKDPSPLPSATSAKSKKTLLEKLKQQGVNLISETDYALATINVSQEKPAYSFVLFGRFKRDKLKQAIRKYYLVEESAAGYWLITQNAKQPKEKDPCAVPVKKSAPKQQALHVQNDRVVLSSPEFMPVLLKRFAQKAHAGVSLTKWRKFRKEKAVAGALMTPKEANKGAVDLPSAMLLGAVSSQPLTELYAGAVVSMLPSPGFTFLIDAHSKEAAWPLDFKTKYDAWQSEVVNDLNEMPTLASLFKSLKVQTDGNILRFKTIANKTTLNNLEKVPAEFIKMIFENVSFGDDKAGLAGAEQIVKEENLKKYASTFNFSSAKDFDPKSSFYKLDHVVGPFGVRLKKIGLLSTDDSIIELKISAEGKGFENLSGELMHKSDDSPAASLIVTSVEDKEGNNLLREEQCGKTRNIVAASLNTSRDKEYIDGKWISKSLKVSGDKSIRLKTNVPLSQVAKIKGKIVIRAATSTKVQTVQQPFKNKTVETNKVRMFLKNSNPGTVKYDLSGDMNHIMAIRAKNAKGQYLADSSSSASGEKIKTISKRFKGKVASIEVIVAENMVSKEYPFEINKIALQYGKPGKGTQIGMMTTSKKAFLRKYAKVKYKDACKDKQKVELGAFLVCLNKFGDRWGREIGGEFDVIAPAEEALQNDLTAGVLSIDSVQTESGEKIAFNKNERVGFEYKFDARYNDKKKDWDIVNKRLHGSNVRIFSDKEELKNKKVNMVNGTLTIRIPKRPKHFYLDANDIGVFKKSDNGITANIAAFEDWSTYIDLQGPVNKVMRFMALAKDGTILKTANDRINEKQYSTFGKSKEEKEKIKALPKKWQGMITVYGKPEVIRIYYANDFEIIKRKFQLSIKK